MFKFFSNQKKLKISEIIKMRLLVVFIILVHFTFASQDQETSLKVELKQADGSIKTQDLIEFIQEGKLKMSTVGCRKESNHGVGLDGRGQEYTCQLSKRYTLRSVRV